MWRLAHLQRSTSGGALVVVAAAARHARLHLTTRAIWRDSPVSAFVPSASCIARRHYSSRSRPPADEDASYLDQFADDPDFIASTAVTPSSTTRTRASTAASSSYSSSSLSPDDPYNSSFNSFAPHSTFVSSHYRIDPQAVLKYIGERKNLQFQRVGTDRVNIRDCPFCRKPTYGKSDNQYKLTVWLDTGSHNCLRCGAKGSWFDFKKKLGDIPNITNMLGSKMDDHRLYSGGGNAGPDQQATTKPGSKPAPPLPIQSVVHQYPSNLFSVPKYAPVLTYLFETRGLTHDTLRHYQIGACMHKFPNAQHVFEEQMCITLPWVKTKDQLLELKAQMEPQTKDAAKKKPASTKKAAKPPTTTTPPLTKEGLIDLGKPISIDLMVEAVSATPVQGADATTPAANTSSSATSAAVAAATAAAAAPPAALFSDQVTERIKLRSLVSKGNQRLLPSGGAWNFFGWHTVPMDAEELVITEGEFDAMAVWQATGLPSVSLPNGARSLPVELLPLLEKFRRIYLWLDDDAAGTEGAEKFAKKLGVGRCLIVKSSLAPRRDDTEQDHATSAASEQDEADKKPPPKDANDALRQGANLMALVAAAQPLKHEQILRFSDLRSEVLREFTDPLARRGVQSRYLPGLNRLLKGHRRGELTIVTGATGVGKCWGRGTSLMMHDGTTRSVEDVQEGDLLMGDDGLPRMVKPGSLTQGNTRHDAKLHAESVSIETAPATYRVDWCDNGLNQSWTCNGDHILVLQCDARPRVACERSQYVIVAWFVVKAADGRPMQLVERVVETLPRFPSRRLAEAHLATWLRDGAYMAPRFEISVNDFLKLSHEAQRCSAMYTPAHVDFPPPSSSSSSSSDDKATPRSLQARLTSIMQLLGKLAPAQEPTSQMILDTAWLLGLIMVDGLKAAHTPAVRQRLESWFATVDQARPALDAEQAPLATPAPVGAVLNGILASYQLLDRSAPKVVPFDLQTDSGDVRRHFLAGVLDGAGHIQSRAIEVAKPLEGLVFVARSLGFRMDALESKEDEETATSAALLRISGRELHTIPASLTQADPSLLEDPVGSDPRCSRFTLTKVPHADYFGFTVCARDGSPSNGRFLMGDFTVTHNTTVLSQISLDYCSQGVNTLWGSFEIRNTKLARTMISQYANTNFSTEIGPPPNQAQQDETSAEGGMGVPDPQQVSEAVVPQPVTSPPPNPEVIADFNKWADRFEQLPLYFMKFFGSNSVETVLDAMDYAVYVYDVEHILLDNLQFMLSDQGKGGFDRFETQDRAISAFRQFASEKNVHITLVIHPRKEHDSHALGVASIFGGAKATQEADNIIIIQKPVAVDENALVGAGAHAAELARLRSELGGNNEDSSWLGQHRRLEVKKNRFDGELGSIPFKYDKKTCRIHEIQGGKRPNAGGGGGGGGSGDGAPRAPPTPRPPRPTRAVMFGGDQTNRDSELATENANRAAQASMQPKKPAVKKQVVVVDVELDEPDAEPAGAPKKKRAATKKKPTAQLALEASINVNPDALQLEAGGEPPVKKTTRKKAAAAADALASAASAPSLSSPPIEVVAD